MGERAVGRLLGSGVLAIVVFFSAGCGNNSRSTGTTTNTGGGTPGAPGGTSGPTTGPPRFLYFATGSHPSGVSLDQNGIPGPVQDYSNPDPGRSNSFVAANPGGTFLYVTEYENTGSGVYYVAGFSIDHNTGALTHTATVQVANDGVGIRVDPSGAVLALAGSSANVPDAANPTLALYKIASDGSLTSTGTPLPLYGQRALDLIFDAGGQNVYVLSSQAQPATPGASLQAFHVDATAGTATAVQSIPLSIDASEIAVSGSKYVYVSGVGNSDSNVAGYSIQSDGSLAPITGTPFGSGATPYGLAASPNGSTVYASDLLKQDMAWYAVGTSGALSFSSSTAPNTIIPEVTARMMVDRSGKYVYSTACQPGASTPGCEPVLWGGTIASDGSLSPMSGAPFQAGVYQFDLVY